MSYNGTGTFVINTTGQPVVTGTVISSSVFNALTSDLATGLSTAITKDGQTTITNNIPFSNNKITGLGVATASGDALSYGQAATVSTLTVSGLTSGRVPYATTAGLFTDSANLTFNGTTLTANTIGAFTLSGTIAGGGNQLNNIVIGTSTPLAGSFTTVSASTSVTTPSVTNAGTLALSATGANIVTASTNGSERMRIDSSGNVGIGTNSPSKLLHLYSTGNNAYTRYVYSGSGSYFEVGQGGDSIAYVWNATNTAMLFGTNNTERMRIDSSGNVGIGTTSLSAKLTVYGAGSTANNPSTSASLGSTLAVQDSAGSSGNGGMVMFGASQGFFAAIKGYITNGGNNTTGDLIFATRNATTDSTLTERMRIDSSGNVGIGTTSPSYKLDVSGTGRFTSTIDCVTSTAAAYGLRIIADAANTYAGIQFTNNPVTSSFGYYRMPSSSVHAWYDSSASEKMRIDSSGNVGIGTSSPAGKLNVSDGTVIGEINPYSASSGCYIGTRSNHAVLFEVNASEKARIDTSGNLLVGTTSTLGGKLSIKTSGETNAYLTNDTAGGYIIDCDAASNGGTYYFINFRKTGTGISNITSNGTTVAYNTGSDYRLKDNIQPIKNALETVAKLKPSTWDWKKFYGSGSSQGFVAHELQAVVPDCVTGEKDEIETYIDEKGVEQIRPKYQGVDTSFLVATLTAAIQELKAELDATKAEIAALKGA